MRTIGSGGGRGTFERAFTQWGWAENQFGNTTEKRERSGEAGFWVSDVNMGIRKAEELKSKEQHKHNGSECRGWSRQELRWRVPTTDGSTIQQWASTLHQSEWNTGNAWTLNQLWSSHSRRFVPELKRGHSRNKLNHLFNWPELH
jgi:hypothetical protein